jgi:two-component system, response regulator YesN
MTDLTLLIADDEPIERDTMTQFIVESLPLFGKVEVAANGFELIDKAERFRPDVMVVDVEMPGMSGLDAIAMLRKKGISGRVIIYSAYDYFNYAQEAIELGVDAYMIKPVRRTELVKTLTAEAERALEDRKTAKENSLNGDLYAKVSPLLQAEFIKSILLDDVDGEAMSLSLSLLDIAIDNGCMLILRLPEDAVPSDKLRAILQGPNRLRTRALVGQPSHGDCSVYLHFLTPLDDERLFEQCNEWADAKRNKISQLYAVRPEIGVGSPCRRAADLRISYQRSLSALHGGKRQDDETTDPFKKSWNQLQLFIWDGDCTKAETLLHRIFGEFSLAGVPLDECRRMTREFIIHSWQDIKRKSGTDRSTQDLVGLTLEAFEKQTSLLAIMDLTDSCVGEMADFIRNGNKASAAGYIRAALSYIEKSYMKPISLDFVANAIGISPYYLSHLFKQELNITFLQYVTKYRMRQAEHIRAETGLPLEKIAERVGYKDGSYFKKIFSQFQANPEEM